MSSIINESPKSISVAEEFRPRGTVALCWDDGDVQVFEVVKQQSRLSQIKAEIEMPRPSSGAFGTFEILPEADEPVFVATK